MNNWDKLIHKTAKELDLPINVVKDIARFQFKIARINMIAKNAVSIYMPKIGIFVSPEVRLDLHNKKYNKVAEKIKAREKQKEEDGENDPFEF